MVGEEFEFKVRTQNIFTQKACGARLGKCSLNALKTLATDKINELRASLSAGGDDEGLGIDWSRTAYPTPLGSRHPLTIVQQEICSIFARLGFSIAEGPEIDDDCHVLSALNFAEDHPARDMQDTFFVRS